MAQTIPTAVRFDWVVWNWLNVTMWFKTPIKHLDIPLLLSVKYSYFKIFNLKILTFTDLPTNSLFGIVGVGIMYDGYSTRVTNNL